MNAWMNEWTLLKLIIQAFIFSTLTFSPSWATNDNIIIVFHLRIIANLNYGYTSQRDTSSSTLPLMNHCCFHWSLSSHRSAHDSARQHEIPWQNALIPTASNRHRSAHSGRFKGLLGCVHMILRERVAGIALPAVSCNPSSALNQDWSPSFKLWSVSSLRQISLHKIHSLAVSHYWCRG